MFLADSSLGQHLSDRKHDSYSYEISVFLNKYVIMYGLAFVDNEARPFTYYPIVIKLALPPAAAVLTLNERS